MVQQCEDINATLEEKELPMNLGTAVAAVYQKNFLKGNPSCGFTLEIYPVHPHKV